MKVAVKHIKEEIADVGVKEVVWSVISPVANVKAEFISPTYLKQKLVQVEN